jgi:hypothetical protein
MSPRAATDVEMHAVGGTRRATATFDQIGLTPRSGNGLRTRTLDLWTAEIRPYAFVRITAHDGPWPFWLAELAFPAAPVSSR